MSTVTVYGASDDLVEIEGDLREEFSGDGMWLAFGDGTILDIKYTGLGVWRISAICTGSAKFSKIEAPADDEDNYSDRVTLTGDLRWVLGAEEPILHKIAASPDTETGPE